MAKRARECPPEAGGPTIGKRSRRDILSIRQSQDEIGVARCPLCQGVLIARMARAGPKFFCRCPPRKMAA